MRLTFVAAMILAGMAVVSGCTSARPFQTVDLGGPLSSADLHRYDVEWKELQDANPGKPLTHAVLEHSNWWELGLLIYHRDATVMRLESPKGPVYHVSYGEGYGPLSLLYAVSTNATYDARGVRLNWTRLHDILLANVALGYESVTELSNGMEETTSAWYVFDNLICYDKMNKGSSYVSILTLPNPIGTSVDGGQ